MASEMKFGVNVAAPFVGMKRDDCIDYPYAKQVRLLASTSILVSYCIELLIIDLYR